MDSVKHFLKGIIVGIGGIAPGLSGSVLMVILGIYTKVINAIATLFKNFKKNFLYLLPIGIGMILGIAIFSRFINFALDNYEIPTRGAFFGLLIGTIPLFYKEVNKHKNLNKYHFLLMILAFGFGLYFLTFASPASNSNDLNVFQSFVLGFIGISATVIPGIDGASVLSALGMYDNWLDLTSLSSINLAVYIPAGIGIVMGGFVLSMVINRMLKKGYTATFSVLFGFFLSVIPSVLKSSDGGFINLGSNMMTYVGIVMFILGIVTSYWFSRMNEEKKT